MFHGPLGGAGWGGGRSGCRRFTPRWLSSRPQAPRAPQPLAPPLPSVLWAPSGRRPRRPPLSWRSGLGGRAPFGPLGPRCAVRRRYLESGKPGQAQAAPSCPATPRRAGRAPACTACPYPLPLLAGSPFRPLLGQAGRSRVVKPPRGLCGAYRAHMWLWHGGSVVGVHGGV